MLYNMLCYAIKHMLWYVHMLYDIRYTTYVMLRSFMLCYATYVI